MIDTTPSIRLTGLRDAVAAESYFASSLVDVAYLTPTGPDTADILLDGIDIRSREQREWITGILRDALSECGEPQASIEYLRDLDS